MNLPPALEHRVTVKNEAPVRPDGTYVLYWMNAARRPYDNFALQRAVDWARELHRPLVVLEALRVGYPWASDRLHRFVLDGMRDNQRYFEAKCTYHAHLEREPGAGSGLVPALAQAAAVVVSDDSPAFFLPRMVAAASARVRVRFEAVDGNGMMPLSAPERPFARAADFRRVLHRHFLTRLGLAPTREPLRGLELRATVPEAVARRYPGLCADELDSPGRLCAGLPIDHGVSSVATRGGYSQAERALGEFVESRLPRYGERGDPLQSPESGLSPYLHFGHISPHHVFARVAHSEGFAPSPLAVDAVGRREGFWGLSPPAESFLDELLTWRELGYHFARHAEHHDTYAAVPGWARASLRAHQADPREHLYSLEQLERAETADPLWNAAQRQLVREGTIHGYLRMLWGKSVLAWTRTPEEAHAILVELNNKYALDGRDPNSYSGIGWCFGLFDRPWGPERPIFGKVRYMNAEGARRKFQLENYLHRFA